MVGRDSRAGGHHPGRGEAGERHQQQRRAEAHASSSAARSGRATTPCAARRSTRGSSSPGRRPATPSWAATRRPSTLLDVTVASLKRQGHEPDAAELDELREQGRRRLRAADRRPLRRRPALGGCDHRPGRDARCPDSVAGSRHPPRQRRAVSGGGVSGVTNRAPLECGASAVDRHFRILSPMSGAIPNPVPVQIKRRWQFSLCALILIHRRRCYRRRGRWQAASPAERCSRTAP